MSILQQADLSGKTALVTDYKREIRQAMAMAIAEAGTSIIGVSATIEVDGSTFGEDVRA